jgi:transcriptional regulator with XRE-family HTH domain
MTPFGKLTRTYRKDRGILLGDLSALLGCSPSFLSQIEAGNKPIPSGFPGRVAVALNLSEREGAALERAANLSAKEFRLTVPADARAKDREMARLLSVSFARMSTVKKDKILRILREEADA